MNIDLSHDPKLFLAIELGKRQWTLCFNNGSKLRRRCVAGLDVDALLNEIELAKLKMGLDPKTPVLSCYEAGRDGFWLHRFLLQNGIKNFVFDSSSIEVNRKARQTKTDRVDAEKLVGLLIRKIVYQERRAVAIVRVPSPEHEARMRPGRERKSLVGKRTGLINQIKSILMIRGIAISNLNSIRGADLSQLKGPDGQKLPAEHVDEIKRCFERMVLVETQITQLEEQQKTCVEECRSDPELCAKMTQLMRFRGIGLQMAWTLVHEFFWRDFRNRKQVGACAGLTGSPFQSGESHREQGISKTGNKRVRTCCVEMAWSWLRYQPNSALSQWFNQRYGKGGSRSRRKGIVALARKLLVALWKFLERQTSLEGEVIIDGVIAK